jgi:hypothetical protein
MAMEDHHVRQVGKEEGKAKTEWHSIHHSNSIWKVLTGTTHLAALAKLGSHVLGQANLSTSLGFVSAHHQQQQQQNRNRLPPLPPSSQFYGGHFHLLDSVECSSFFQLPHPPPSSFIVGIGTSTSFLLFPVFLLCPPSALLPHSILAFFMSNMFLLLLSHRPLPELPYLFRV